MRAHRAFTIRHFRSLKITSINCTSASVLHSLLVSLSYSPTQPFRYYICDNRAILANPLLLQVTPEPYLRRNRRATETTCSEPFADRNPLVVLLTEQSHPLSEDTSSSLDRLSRLWSRPLSRTALDTHGTGLRTSLSPGLFFQFPFIPSAPADPDPG